MSMEAADPRLLALHATGPGVRTTFVSCHAPTSVAAESEVQAFCEELRGIVGAAVRDLRTPYFLGHFNALLGSEPTWVHGDGLGEQQN